MRPLRNRLAEVYIEVYIDVSQPQWPVEVLYESLAKTGNSVNSVQARRHQELGNQKLEERETRYTGS